MEKDNFFKFSNRSNEEITELYVYGEIISGSEKWDESDVTFKDFQDSLNNIKDGSTLNMYVSSPGGNVFTTQSMISMIQRAKSTKNIRVVAYLDGLGASCASWLLMVADEIIIYSNSIMMVHKPMSCIFGNADEFQKEIDILNKLEDNIMLPMYMKKAKVTEDEMKDMIKNETWLSADEIQEKFNVTYVDEEKQVAAKLNTDILNKYHNVPKDLKTKSFFNAQKPKNTEIDAETQALINRINEKQKQWNL